MSMLRLAERVMGEGDLSRRGTTLARVGYELARYNEVRVEEGEMTRRGDLVEGHLHAPPEALDALLGTSAPLTLVLDDGRRLDLYVVNTDGLVTSADDRGFY
jgi:hypothetical protein